MCENTGLSLLLVRFSRVMIGQTESHDPIFAQQTLAPSDGKKSLAMAHRFLFFIQMIVSIGSSSFWKFSLLA